MQIDAALNFVALVAPLVLSYCVAGATLRGLRAWRRHAWRARLEQQPFHPRMLPTLGQHTATGLSGLTPDAWYANLADDAIKGRRRRGPSWLDYLEEFHPEKGAWRGR
ncbi:hypothetical protein Caci_2833 [Catenulispora acidiphila DSM 44928]|uniref:Uncharacterized protein n=1 Tax=Catenulispora acidiphila (strain DSM 44928 / JCM 14897 / NBRC 102108 / NRRL B-24433 / ID139908) TaxID=479433 RepID=C7Q167_CATAD|nr:hypothetical protein [Catenulispora acidiphila]ACU71742.1 hypothetical protein Caci_2833 [Catenulispora acidiphila DSM 44928]